MLWKYGFEVVQSKMSSGKHVCPLYEIEKVQNRTANISMHIKYMVLRTSYLCGHVIGCGHTVSTLSEST